MTNTKKRTHVQLQGRVLYLTEDKAQLEAQLYQGQNLPFDQSRKRLQRIQQGHGEVLRGPRAR